MKALWTFYYNSLLLFLSISLQLSYGKSEQQIITCVHTGCYFYPVPEHGIASLNLHHVQWQLRFSEKDKEALRITRRIQCGTLRYFCNCNEQDTSIFVYLFLKGSTRFERQFHLTHDTNLQQYWLAIPEAECTVMCYWWWAEGPTETCRAF